MEETNPEGAHSKKEAPKKLKPTPASFGLTLKMPAALKTLVSKDWSATLRPPQLVDLIRKAQQEKLPDGALLNDDRTVASEIHLTIGGELLVNGKFLRRPRFNSKNEQLFSYIYKNPNETILKDRLNTILSPGEKRLGKYDLHKFIENLGFTGPLRKIHFRVTTDSIYFRNPAYDSDLRELGIKIPRK